MAGGILVAHDLGGPVTPLLRTAGDVSFRLGLPLTVLHVIGDDDLERFQRERPAERAFLDALVDQRRAELGARVAEALGDAHGAQAELRIRRGAVDEVVVKELRDGAFSFGAIGIRSRSRVGKLVFGSSVQSILLRSPCPILTVPIG